MKDAAVVAEMQLLKRLAFDVQVQLPYGPYVNYCQMLGLVGSVGTPVGGGDGEEEKEEEGVVERGWGYLNDWYAFTSPLIKERREGRE
jgi:hypothetical protein